MFPIYHVASTVPCTCQVSHVETFQMTCQLANKSSAMAKDGGLSQYSGNKAGAAYGVGYCDSQCPRDLKFINGQVC